MNGLAIVVTPERREHHPDLTVHSNNKKQESDDA